MTASTTLTVKGIQYYQGPELFQKGKLKVGMALRLEREPNNAYDKNAVSVHVAPSGEKLGHLSRASAPKYAQLVRFGRINSVEIAKLQKSGSAINIEIAINYDGNDNEIRRDAQLLQSISKIPNLSGVYSIRNTRNNRYYIGSSTDMKSRLKAHVSHLEYGNHHNRSLAADFIAYGNENFEATVLELVHGTAALLLAEERQIAVLNNAGIPLYNSTVDGKGIKSSRTGSDVGHYSVVAEFPRKGTYIITSHEVLKKIPSMSLADLAKIRAELFRYRQEKEVAEAHNCWISAKSQMDVTREETAREADLRREGDRVAIQVKWVRELAQRIDANRINFFASIWTPSIEYSLRSSEGKKHTVRLKATPSNRKLTGDHQDAVRNLEILKNGALAISEQSKTALLNLPNDKISVNLSLGNTVLSLSKLDIVALDWLIREREVMGL